MAYPPLTIVSSGDLKGSYAKSSHGILRLALIISQLCVGISFIFIYRLNYWSYWSTIPPAFVFYIILAGIVFFISIIIYILQLFDIVTVYGYQWRNIIIGFDILFLLFTLIDIIAFAVLASNFILHPYFDPSSFIAASVFSAVSFIIIIVDIILWMQPVVYMT